MGEDYLDPWNTGSAPAAHAIYYLTPPYDWSYSTIYAAGYLDGWGCTSVSLAPGNYWIWRFTDDVTGNGVTFGTFYMSGGYKYYDLDYTGIAVNSGTTWINTSPSWNSETIQVAGITGQVITQQGNVGLGMSGYYEIHTNEGCGVQYSCYNAFTNVTSISPDAIGGGATHAAWKFIITHEIGHHVQFLSMGYPSYGYDLSSTHPKCRCDHYDEYWGNNIHCIQSREQTGGAALEGFAHMFAARVFNSTSSTNATFNYYKPFLNPWGDTDDPPLGFDAYNPSQWMEGYCLASNQGTEIDWLNFYYRVSAETSADRTTMANLFSIHERACGTPGTNCNGQTVHWSNLVNAAQTHYGFSSSQFLHFRTIGENAGVDH
jgi:hypothetical protein